jgi:histidinol-phosphatase (PHP family)
MLANLHTHTSFSDGSDDPVAYVLEAIRQGFLTLGFSDHSPLPFDNTFALRESDLNAYCQEIGRLKQHFKDEIHLFLGMEADFIPGTGHPFSYFQTTLPLDYLIGSVHLVRNGSSHDLWFIDGPDPATYDDGLNTLFGGDIRKGVTAYYRQINEMLTTSRMDVIGHLDKIKMHNNGRFFSESEPWYSGLVSETLDLVRQTGTIIEVNTRGLYKKRSDSLFPGPSVLKKIHEMNIPVIISSDAHKPREISLLFSETADILFEIGFREVMNLTPDGWETLSLRS